MCSEDGDHSDSANNTSENDLITLGELTEYEERQWRFPDNTQRCPLRSCGNFFGTRKKAIEHYRKSHAKHAVLCEICNVPLMLLTAAHHLNGHYLRKHPGIEPPVKVKTSRHECSVCHATFKNYVYLNNHMKRLHRKKKKEKPRKFRPKKRKAKVNALKTPKTTGKVDQTMGRSNTESPSWEDIESVSIVGDATLETPADETPDVAMDSPTPAKTNAFGQAVKRKPCTFNLQQKPRPCTICGRSLKNFVLATSHYRQQHGRAVSMCPFCWKYFTKSTSLIEHMTKYHHLKGDGIPKLAKRPKVSGKPKKSTVNKGDQNDEHGPETVFENVESNDKTLDNGQPFIVANDLNTHEHIDNSFEVPSESNEQLHDDEITTDFTITLGEMTEYPVEQWIFPDQTSCPRTNCKLMFKTRFEAFKHYKDTHSIYDVLCKVCNVLVSLSGAHNLINHYKRIHPDNDLPAKAVENKTACHICNKMLSFQQMRIHLFKHNSGGKQLPSKVNKSDRILKRKSLYVRETDSESKQAKKPTRAMLRSKSLHHLSHSTSAQVELSEPNDLDQSHEQHDQPQPSATSTPEHSSNIQQESLGDQSSCGPSGKQKTRSIGVRGKACKICGFVLMNYVTAVDHYHTVHGRNVMACPYCLDEYFLQSHLLRQHVLLTHSKDNVYAEAAKKAQTDVLDMVNDEHDISHDVNVPDAKTYEVSIQNDDTVDAGAPVSDTTLSMKSNAPECDQHVNPKDEPLNLTVHKCNGQDNSDLGIIDLSNGALDLRLKK